MESYNRLETLSKSSAYSKLIEIGNSNKDVDVSKYISEMVGSDSVPFDVLVFINKYIPIPQLETYNSIYWKRRKNPLYRNMVNESLPPIDKALALSSFMTRAIITMKDLPESNRQEYADIMNIPIISEAISRYTNYGDSDTLEEVFMMVRDVFKKLYSRGDE